MIHHRIPTGIGRPADKRASHVLPRQTLGAAREAGLDDHVCIGEVAELLTAALGKIGARGQILAGLRSEELTSTCVRFVGVQPSAFSVKQYPENASNFRLPSIFWAPQQWAQDGEHVADTSSPEREIFRRGQKVGVVPATQGQLWSFNVDWNSGNFAVSTSYRHGTLPSSRRAIGVQLCRGQADLLLRLHGLPGFRPSYDQLVNWMSERLTENPKLSQNMAEVLGRAAFPTEKRPYLRTAYQKAIGKAE